MKDIEVIELKGRADQPVRTKDIREEFEKYGLHFGRSLGSKRYYSDAHPDNFIVFNARIYTKDFYEREKNDKIQDWFQGMEDEIWYGDIDFNKDIYKLVKAQRDMGVPIVITYESGTKIMEIC